MRTRLLFRLLTPVSSLVARQLAQPSGWLGRVVMTRALNRGNQQLIRATLDRLALTAETRLLDIGFGGGLSLDLAVRRVLATGGQLAIGFSSSQKLRSFDFITRHGFVFHESSTLLAEATHAGFVGVQLAELHGGDIEGDAVLFAST